MIASIALPSVSDIFTPLQWNKVTFKHFSWRQIFEPSQENINVKLPYQVIGDLIGKISKVTVASLVQLVKNPSASGYFIAQSSNPRIVFIGEIEPKWKKLDEYLKSFQLSSYFWSVLGSSENRL